MTFSLIGRDTSSRVFDSIIAVNRREQGPYFTFNNPVFLGRGFCLLSFFKLSLFFIQFFIYSKL